MYVAVGDAVYTSTDKEDWDIVDVELGEFSHVVYADKFYMSVDGVGIYSFDGDAWVLEVQDACTYTHAITVDGVPMFGTADGRIMYGPSWNFVFVAPGAVSMIYDTQFHVVVDSETTLETFSGTLFDLVSEGTTDIEDFTVTDTWYDTQRKIFVVAAYATDDKSPVFFNYSKGEWTMVFSDLDTHAVSLADGGVATENAVYTTTDYVSFDLLHTFEDFEVRTLLNV